MSYKLSLEQKPSYLHAVVSGKNSIENVAGYLEDLRRESAARNCFRVLVEERLEGPRLGMLDVFQLVSDGSSRASGMFKAIAFVDINADSGQMKFAETVALNRGIPVKLFSKVADAEAWLLAAGGQTGA